jgi:hypothetical protein
MQFFFAILAPIASNQRRNPSLLVKLQNKCACDKQGQKCTEYQNLERKSSHLRETKGHSCVFCKKLIATKNIFNQIFNGSCVHSHRNISAKGAARVHSERRQVNNRTIRASASASLVFCAARARRFDKPRARGGWLRQ